MRILADENMPGIEALCANYGEVTRFSGRALSEQPLDDVDALLVRSVSKISAELLQQAPALKFVGTATIGTDHLDIPALAAANIPWASAPGCNAEAVCDYVFSALYALATRHDWRLRDKTVGIVGVGQIGSRLQKRFAALGMRVLCCDPPRAEQEGEAGFVSLATIVAEADIITLHVPLNRSGEHATFHMVDEALLDCLKDGAVLINACRGQVVDNAVLKQALRSGLAIYTVMDVWEHEPDPDPSLIELVDIVTPHIAGYSLEGKWRGSMMVCQAMAEVMGLSPLANDVTWPASWLSAVTLNQVPDSAQLAALIHALYDVRQDDQRFRSVLGQRGAFDALRKNYPLRRELASTRISLSTSALNSGVDIDNLYGLGFARP